MVDATTQAALEAQVLYWRVLLYADFDGDVLRATSGLYDKTVSSVDAELTGTYESYDHNLIEVGAVQHNETGSDTVAISLNGLLLNTDYLLDRLIAPVYDRSAELIRMRTSNFLNVIGDKTRWQGRTARIWFYCVDENENQVGSIIPYYTGYMNDVTINGSAEMQKVTLTIENYIVSISGAQNKTYLQQAIYDPNDNSANASIAAANGIQDAMYSYGGFDAGYAMGAGGYNTALF